MLPVCVGVSVPINSRWVLGALLRADLPRLFRKEKGALKEVSKHQCSC